MKSFTITQGWMAALMLTVGFALFGCGGGDGDGGPQPSGKNNQTAVTLPAGLLVTDAPTGARAVPDLKSSAKEGDEVVMRVVIGGREKPIVQNRAVMTVVDAALVNQCLAEDDHCESPWDYCCAAPEDLLTHSATVQVLDDQGKPLAIDLSSSKLKPLATLIVKGKVGPRPDAKALVINASAIFIESAPVKKN